MPKVKQDQDTTLEQDTELEAQEQEEQETELEDQNEDGGSEGEEDETPAEPPKKKLPPPPKRKPAPVAPPKPAKAAAKAKPAAKAAPKKAAPTEKGPGKRQVEFEHRLKMALTALSKHGGKNVLIQKVHAPLLKAGLSQAQANTVTYRMIEELKYASWKQLPAEQNYAEELTITATGKAALAKM